MKNLNHLKIFEDIDWDDPFADSEDDGNYIVTIRKKADLDIFTGRLIRDGFKIINKFAFGVLIIKNNGKLEKLREYPEVKDAHVEEIHRAVDDNRRPMKFYNGDLEQGWVKPDPKLHNENPFRILKKK